MPSGARSSYLRVLDGDAEGRNLRKLPMSICQFRLTGTRLKPILHMETRPKGDLRVARNALSLFLCADATYRRPAAPKSLLTLATSHYFVFDRRFLRFLL